VEVGANGVKDVVSGGWTVWRKRLGRGRREQKRGGGRGELDEKWEGREEKRGGIG